MLEITFSADIKGVSPLPKVPIAIGIGIVEMTGVLSSLLLVITTLSFRTMWGGIGDGGEKSPKKMK